MRSQGTLSGTDIPCLQSADGIPISLHDSGKIGHPVEEKVPPYYPRGNDQAEAFIHTLNRELPKWRS